MAKKLDFQQLMLEKGEKIGLGVAAVLMLIMMIFGGMAVTSAKSPAEIKTDLNRTAEDIKRKVQNNPALMPQTLPDHLTKGGMKFPELAYAEHKTDVEFFNLVSEENAKRRNPVVYKPVEFQVDLTRTAIKVNDVTKDAKEQILVGVITQQEVRNEGVKAPKKKKAVRGTRLTPLPGGVPQAAGAFPGAGGPMGGGMMPGMTARGGFVDPRQQFQFNPNAKPKNVEAAIEYVSLDTFEKNQGKYRISEVLLPARMVVVNGSFPYRQQMEELARALRFESLEAMMADSTVGMSFRGLDVRRQVRRSDTNEVVQKWADYDWQTPLAPIVARTTDFEPEDPNVVQVVPRIEDELTVPLPQVARAKYPAVTLETIKKSVEAIRAKIKSTEPVIQESAFARALKSKTGKVFDGLKPETPQGNQPGVAATPGKGGVRLPAGMEAVGGAQLTELDLIPEYVLLRFLDLQVQSGYTYEYQVRVKLYNPNFGQKDLVGRPSFAEQEEIAGEWVQTPAVKVTDEAFLYVSDVKQTPDRKPITPTSETAMIQMQRWYEAVPLGADDKRGEPIGDWVVADIPVKVGEYVGGKQAIHLPLWSPTQNMFVLRESSAPERRTTRPTAVPPPSKPGVTVNFSTGSVLVGVEGGTGPYPAPPRNPKLTVADDAGTELLMLTPDGRLLAYNSAQQKDDPDRQARQKDFEAWVKQVEEATRGLAPAPGVPGAAGKDPFGK
jgi:hypothetical protein